MPSYEAALKAHLARYAARRLGVREAGIYRGRLYPHILPYRLRHLNFIESVRAEVQEYLRTHRHIRLHKFFHHLNSSQALAFNLFFPFLSAGGGGAAALTTALGLPPDPPDEWCFEYIPDAAEETNVDVGWGSRGDSWTYCEVKLTEGDYGAAQADQRHLDKLERIYRPRLQGLVEASAFQARDFFRGYQFFRNVSLLSTGASRRVLFLLPMSNERLRRRLGVLLERLLPDAAPRVHVAYLEDTLSRLQHSGGKLTCIADALVEKYLVPGYLNGRLTRRYS